MRLAYRADQVGSLLRPTELLEARAARPRGRVARDALRLTPDDQRLKLELVAKVARRV